MRYSARLDLFFSVKVLEDLSISFYVCLRRDQHASETEALKEQLDHSAECLKYASLGRMN